MYYPLLNRFARDGAPRTKRLNKRSEIGGGFGGELDNARQDLCKLHIDLMIRANLLFVLVHCQLRHLASLEDCFELLGNHAQCYSDSEVDMSTH